MSEDAVRVRCPYCKKIFLWKKKNIAGDTPAVNLQCPYCKEQLVIKREMLGKV